jgi:8-oxo-dGTP pyrophosphatase MutT (NUDIX family)
MTQDEFAELLGVARRTVAAWHEKQNTVLRPELQRALDTAHDRAPEHVKLRFARQLQPGDGHAHQAEVAVALTVAIAIVVTEAAVLLVCRRDPDPSGITWQFPAGIVKPGSSASATAVRETLAETGIHCLVRSSLGSRIHPLTGVRCEYYLCDYLAGDVENRDSAENVSAIWVHRSELTKFIPADMIFEPVMRELEMAS